MRIDFESKPIYGDDDKYINTLLEECKYLLMMNLIDDDFEKSEILFIYYYYYYYYYYMYN